MSSKYISKAVEQLGWGGFLRVVATSCCRVPSRPEPPTKFADTVWACELPVDLAGRTYAITGASSGMGKHLAEKLAERGAVVLMLNRKSPHSSAALEAVKLKTAAKNGYAETVHLVDCDLCDFESVRRAAGSVKAIASELGLDGLICNAGLMGQADKRTGDGYDMQIQVNHLSHFLLSSLLFDVLVDTGKKRGVPARIVQHTSGARNSPDEEIHADCFAKEWETLFNAEGKQKNPRKGDDVNIAKWMRYQQSKRLNLGFTYALADYAKSKGVEKHVIATCAHPGATNSGLQSRTAGNGFMDNLINGIAACVGHSTADGCLGLALATLKPDAQNGAFYGPPVTELIGNAVLLDSEREKFGGDQLDLIMTGSADATDAQFPK